MLIAVIGDTGFSGVAVVVALERLHQLRGWPDHGDPLPARSQGQDTIVLEQHHGLATGLQRQRAVLRGIVLRERYPAVRIGFRRIEHAQAKARGEQPLERSVQLGLGD